MEVKTPSSPVSISGLSFRILTKTYGLVLGEQVSTLSLRKPLFSKSGHILPTNRLILPSIHRQPGGFAQTPPAKYGWGQKVEASISSIRENELIYSTKNPAICKIIVCYQLLRIHTRLSGSACTKEPCIIKQKKKINSTHCLWTEIMTWTYELYTKMIKINYG